MNKVLTGLIFVWLITLTVITIQEREPPEVQEVLIVHQEYDDLFKDKECNALVMSVACEYYGIKYPNIVTAQAILESGNFKSRLFKEYNNPFGLYNSKKKDYFKFKHWTDAILAYQTMIEYKYKGGDYYQFLDAIGYAEDPNYIRKVRVIESNLPP